MNIHQLKGAIPDARPIAVSGMLDDEYRSLPGLTQSDLNLFSRSPRLFREGLRERTSAMDSGTIVHGLILRPSEQHFHVRPDTYGPDGKRWNGNANECKAWLAQHTDKPVVSAHEARGYLAAAKAVIQHETAAHWLDKTHREIAILTALGKGRLDAVGDAGPHWNIIEVKTTSDGRYRRFQKSVHEYGYHIQAAWYRRLLREIVGPVAVRHRIIAVELDPVPRINVFTMADRAVDLGDERIDWLLERMEECSDKASWPDYHRHDQSPDGMIDLPEYAYPEPELTGLTEITT